MNTQNLQKSGLWRSGMMLAAIGLTIARDGRGQQDRGILVITSTNNSQRQRCRCIQARYCRDAIALAAARHCPRAAKAAPAGTREFCSFRTIWGR